jgi:predicted DNA-binding protein YlxM (UPF0122 family)
LNELRLTQRSRKIIESYFGIDCEEKTLNDLAQEFNVCRQGIEQSLNMTLQRLARRQSSSHRLLLQAYQPANAMGTAEEARIRSAQQRASLLRTARQRESPNVAHAGGSALR